MREDYNMGCFLCKIKKKRKKKKKRNNKYISIEERLKADEEKEKREEMEEEIIERNELIRGILEEYILDIIEDEVDRRGGIKGLDGETISDILSYYMANDPRFQLKLQRELTRR